MVMVWVNIAIIVTVISSNRATLNEQNSLMLESGGINSEAWNWTVFSASQTKRMLQNHI